MLKYIEEFGKHVIITGFRNARIDNTERFLERMDRKKPSSVEIQFFDAGYVASWQHLYFAVLNALTAFKNKQNISKSLAIETMLYASAQRQIRKAMDFLGIEPDTTNIAVLITGEKHETVETALSLISAHVTARQDDAVLALSEEKTKAIQRAFEISSLELETVMRGDDPEEALTNLVIERMALLATKR